MRDHDSTRHASLLGGHLARRQVKKATAKAQGTRVLEGRLDRRIPLKAEYKGARFRATLRKDGYITYAGEKFPSPTAAAYKIVGRNVNGWRFWQFRNGTKGWVSLDQIRK
jgi:hypothetical protein